MAIRTVCSYCGVGCGLEVRTTDGPAGPVIAEVTGDRLHPTNRGRLCTKGLTHAELMGSTEGRALTALMRPHRAAAPVPVGVDDAVTAAGRRLREILDTHGPDAVALYVSGQLSLEAQYLATKLAKGFIRTRYLEANSRLCMAGAATGYKQSLGADGPPGSYDDIDAADLFLVSGANMADCHPILFLRMADRLRAGARLIVVDPRRTATADRADLFLQLRAGTDLALLNGLLHLLVADGAVDTDFIAAHTEGWEAMPAFLADYPPHRVAAITGLREADIRTAAAMIAEAGPAWMSLWTMGLNQSTHGTWNTNAVCNLHLATGAICRPGAGPLSLTGQPNAMGGREMGYLGPGLPGQRSVTSPADRAFVEAVWNLPPGTIRAETNQGTVDLFDRLADGTVRACWIICTNPAASLPNRDRVIAGLRAADLVVAQDAYADTATNRHADIVLPAAMWGEADGVMVNSERTLTLARAAVPPAGDARPDWRLICDVAAAMGFGAHFDYADSAEVFDELRRFANPVTGYDLRGVDYQRLSAGPVQWPCPPGDPADRHPIRYLETGRPRFPTPSGRAVFLPRPHTEPHERPDENYPLVLNTGRLPHQWHTMTKTGRVATLNRLDDGPFVELHPDDAAALGITDGRAVELVSRRGRVVLPAVVTDRVRPGSCFAPFHWNDVHGPDLTVNAVTSPAVDPDSLQPELKVCAVRARPIGPAARPRARTRRLTGTGPVVLWASQTGNAERLAASFADILAAHGVRAESAAMGDIDPDELSAVSALLVVTSTFGDGGPPDAAARFWDRLRGPAAPALAGLRYAVLGIGDRSYARFCGYAADLDARLAELGAVRLAERAACEIDDRPAIADWMRRVTAVLNPAVTPVISEPVPQPVRFTRVDPIHAKMSRNELLTPPGSAKEVRQFGFDVAEYGVAYDVGDSLGVFPTNSDADVAAWLDATGLDGDEVIELDGAECALREALTTRYDICAVTPNLVDFLAGAVGDRAAARELRAGLSDLDRWRLGRNGIDVIRRYGVRAEVQLWQQALVRLAPRCYSISSSPLVSPHEIQLTVSVVRYTGPDGHLRGGVCSTYLADRAADTATPVFLQHSPYFRPPADGDVPIVMIGAGTGIAPFRGFLQHRRALGHRGRNWLLFGDRHRAENFYYRDELVAMAAEGLLTRLDVVFSRDQQKRIYVQDKMIEHGVELWRWIADGAHIYVCGDAAGMAAGVDAALTTIIATHGRLGAEAAKDFRRELIAAKRYLRDVY